MFVPKTPLGVEGDIPNPKGPVVLCEGTLTVDGAAVPHIELFLLEDEGCATAPKIELVVVEDEGCNAVPKIEPVVVKDEGCTAGVVIPVTVFPGVWVSEGERFVRNSPPVVAGGKDSAVLSCITSSCRVEKTAEICIYIWKNPTPGLTIGP